jgi:hypothetical protein
VAAWEFLRKPRRAFLGWLNSRRLKIGSAKTPKKQGFPLLPCFLRGRLFQPTPSGVNLGMVEIPDLGHRERLANQSHPLLPRLLSYQSNALNMATLLRGELDVVPKRVHVPAVEILKLGQQPNFAVRFDRAFNCGDKLLVVLVV